MLWGRTQGIDSLRGLADSNPKAHLPHRYLVRPIRLQDFELPAALLIKVQPHLDLQGRLQPKGSVLWVNAAWQDPDPRTCNLQGRVLFHEAALLGNMGMAAQQQTGLRCLEAALQHAVIATELAPRSLSCAALRATLLLNMILEQCVVADSRMDPQPGPALDHLAQHLTNTLKSCRSTVKVAAFDPEAAIPIFAGGLDTKDPCCLVSCTCSHWTAA